MRAPQLIGLDWGTTSCRAYLVGADGAVLDRQLDGPGILKVEGHFGPWLDSMIGAWIATHGAAPVILSGMIGSRQGWKEAPYATCPAGADDIVKALARIEWGELTIALIPGLSTENSGMPDVIRGEETQILGALALSGAGDNGLFLLPGTHSKWAVVRDGRIVSFRTFMTGEVFGALKGHTILGRLMSGDATDAEAFARGVGEGASLESAGALLNRVFATRTYGLMDKLPAAALSDYLSGLLIGAEVAEATRQATAPVTIIASQTLASRYTDALRLLGHDSTLAPQDCVAAGHWRIARAAGLC
jgi:2-dehydro-3-deoxygalactonokinase